MLSRFLDPSVTSFILGILSFVGVWYGVKLSRRGKQEDTRIAETNQSFSQLNELSNARLIEINRLNALVAELRSDNDRIRESWEDRWDRQMKRCRIITDRLTGVISSLEDVNAPKEIKDDVREARRELEDHNTDDHDSAGF